MKQAFDAVTMYKKCGNNVHTTIIFPTKMLVKYEQSRLLFIPNNVTVILQDVKYLACKEVRVCELEYPTSILYFKTKES